MKFWEGWQTGAEASQQQTPKQQTAEHGAQQWGMQTVGMAIGIENTRSMLSDARRRVCDSHHLQMANAGGKASGECGEDMGDISVSGDHYVTNQTQRSVAPLWLSALAAAAATGLIAYLLMRDGEPPTVPPDARNWYNFDIEVERGGAIEDGSGTG